LVNSQRQWNLSTAENLIITKENLQNQSINYVKLIATICRAYYEGGNIKKTLEYAKGFWSLNPRTLLQNKY
jgi:hypothetical protein